jgi:hypothetical protein
LITPVEPWDEPYDADLAALLREGPAELAPPPGAFRRIRRRAAVRRWGRAAAAGGVTAVVVLAAVTLWPAADPGGAPATPLAPPAATSVPVPEPAPTGTAGRTGTPTPLPDPTASPLRPTDGGVTSPTQRPGARQGSPDTGRRAVPSSDVRAAR